MEKNIKELIAEMDRIEALDPNADNEMQEGFRDALKGVMDKIANKLGYQPKDPELADLFQKYEQMIRELDELFAKIEAHPEFKDPVNNRQNPETDPETTAPVAGRGAGAATDPGMPDPLGSPPKDPQK